MASSALDHPPPDPAVPGWHRHPEFPAVECRWDGARWTGEHRFVAAGGHELGPTLGEGQARDPQAVGWSRLRESPGAHEAVAVAVLVLYEFMCILPATASWRCDVARAAALDSLGLVVIVVVPWLAAGQSRLLGRTPGRRLASIVVSALAAVCAVVVGVLMLAFSCMTLFG